MKKYVWLFAKILTTHEEAVQEVIDLTGGKFGNLDAGVCEAMPLASTVIHGYTVGVKVRLDYGQNWYRLQDEGLLTNFAIDTSRPLLIDVTDEDGNVIGQRPNDEPYHYGDAPVLDLDGNPTGETQPQYMCGPGRL